MPTFLTMVWPSDSVHTGSRTHGLMQLTNTVMAREKSLLGLLLLLTAWIQGFRNSGQFVCIKDWNRCQDEQAFKSVVRIRTRLTSITTINLSRREFLGGFSYISLLPFPSFLSFFCHPEGQNLRVRTILFWDRKTSNAAKCKSLAAADDLASEAGNYIILIILFPYSKNGNY